LGSLNEGPILLHVIPPGATGDVFALLQPTIEYRWTTDVAPHVVADELVASISSAWLVYSVQRRFSMFGFGHRLLKAVTVLEPALSRLVERSSRYEEVDEQPQTASADPNSVAGMFTRMKSFEVDRFEEWWTELAPLRKMELTAEGPATQTFRALLAAFDANWRDVFAC